jgi:hypothetical protein
MLAGFGRFDRSERAPGRRANRRIDEGAETTMRDPARQTRNGRIDLGGPVTHERGTANCGALHGRVAAEAEHG